MSELKYFNSCIALGQYYETLFTKKIIPSNKTAIFYYEKVTDFGRFPDDPRYFKALALRNSLCRKLAAIYFDGKGVKKNRKKSLELALKGTSGYDGFYESYSQKYFHCKCIFLKDYTTTNYDSYTGFTLGINPFALQSGIFSAKMLDTRLEKIAVSFKDRLLLDSSLKIIVLNYPETSARSQVRCNRIVENIRFYLVEKAKINSDKVSTNCEVGGGPSNVIDIQFTKE
ncbi:hypothetical protein [Ferruginibacter sp. SUN106]|uniref:hypothetical protein n=1 Tax=Ferruginibacter sp. SUN106 TaxID=2978348 RepID=UPI003D35F475